MRGKFKTGDKVRLKAMPDQRMTVAEAKTKDYSKGPPGYDCQWYEYHPSVGTTFRRQHYREDELELWSPTPGETKPCVECGAVAVYERTSSHAAFHDPGSAHPELMPDSFAWVCKECGHQ